MKKIVIFGAGLTGLTVAHELIEKGFQVDIYEKDDTAGGMAKSIRDEHNVPSEHSWRGYGPFYKNAFEIMKRIPIDFDCNTLESFDEFTIEEVSKHNTENDAWIYYKGFVYNISDYISKHPGGNIIVNSFGKNLEDVWNKFNVNWHNKNSKVLKQLEKYKIGKIVETLNKSPTVYDNLNNNKLNFNLFFDDFRKNPKYTFIDYLFLSYIFLKFFVSNKRRKHYYKIPIEKSLKKFLSNNGYNRFFNYLSGPGFGFDKNTASIGHFGVFIEQNITNSNPWQVMNQPTNEAWIDPWVNYLKSLGVNFHFNHKLNKLNIINNKIQSVDIENNNNINTLSFDEYFICINPFVFEKILINSNLNEMANNYKKLNTINNQISFRFGFDKKINFNKDDAFVMLDSPYNITFYPQDIHWCQNIKLGMNDNIKSLWSGTLILTYNNGVIFNKSATQLSKKQLLKEIKTQIFNSKSFNDYIKKYNHDLEYNIIYEEIYPEWKETIDGLISDNKKWVNNFFNESYRPRMELNPLFNNLYIAGSHTNTSINIWSMESAIESGKYVSNQLLKKYKKKLTYYHKHSPSILLKPFQIIDDILYLIRFPNLIDIIIIILLFKLIKLIKSKN